jgi:hypothetical protein
MHLSFITFSMATTKFDIIGVDGKVDMTKIKNICNRLTSEQNQNLTGIKELVFHHIAEINAHIINMVETMADRIAKDTTLTDDVKVRVIDTINAVFEEFDQTDK